MVLENLFHFLNISIVNSWIIYKENCQDISLLEFKASIVWTILQIGKYDTPKRGRPSLSSESDLQKKKRKNVSIVVPEIKYDNKGHYPSKTTKSQASKCQNVKCTSRTRYICKKCSTPVCPECMEDFHTE